MQPLVFTGKEHPDSFIPYVWVSVGLLGLFAGFVMSFPVFGLGWAALWGGLAYIKHRRRRKDIAFFKIKLDDTGIEIRDRRGSYAARWEEIESVAWKDNGAQEESKLVFNSRTQNYVFDHLLNEVDFSDFSQALKLKVPAKTRDLPRAYYSTYVHGRVVAAHEFRRLKQPVRAEQCYREAIAAGERLGSPLGLGMIPVLEEYAALLERQGKYAEAQAITDRISSLVSRVAL